MINALQIVQRSCGCVIEFAPGTLLSLLPLSLLLPLLLPTNHTVPPPPHVYMSGLLLHTRPRSCGWFRPRACC